MNLLVNEEPTAPQPVSPKLEITLCLSAAHILLLVMSPCAGVVRPGIGARTGRNSTKSQRFCTDGMSLYLYLYSFSGHTCLKPDHLEVDRHPRCCAQPLSR